MNPAEIEPFTYGLHYCENEEEPGWRRAQVSEVIDNNNIQLIYVDVGEHVDNCNPKDFYAIPAEFQQFFDGFEECASCVIFKDLNWPGTNDNFLAELDAYDEEWE